MLIHKRIIGKGTSFIFNIFVMDKTNENTGDTKRVGSCVICGLFMFIDFYNILYIRSQNNDYVNLHTNILTTMVTKYSQKKG